MADGDEEVRGGEGPGLSRRELLLSSLGVMLGAACESGGPADGLDETTGTGETGAACPATASDIEGPFYRPDIPVGGMLDQHGDLGVPLMLTGRVAATSCAALEGAVVELWHATPLAPDGQPGDVDATYDTSEAHRYYGQVATDAEGRYTFTTLRPGWYLNGPAYRPAHLHLKVWVDGVERLTTQLYFEGDPFNEADPWFDPALLIAPDVQGRAEFDIFVSLD